MPNPDNCATFFLTISLFFSFFLSVFLPIACEQALLFGRANRAARERASERRSREGPAPRSRVLARLASLAQIGELARRLDCLLPRS